MHKWMTWEEKLAALKAIGMEISLRMRKPGDWYVDQRGVEVKEGSMLASNYGNGTTPKEAVEAHWQQLTEPTFPGAYIVLHAGDPAQRRALRWTGYMWADHEEG